MADIDLLSTAFSMLSEPVAVSRRSKILYMNQAAIKLAGKDLSDKPLDMLMPLHISNNQADNFITTAFIGSKNCTVKVSPANGLRIYAISYDAPIAEPSEAVLSCLRSSMSNIKFAASCISVIAEDIANDKLTEYVNTLNRSYYRVKRALDNLGTLSGIAAGTLPFHPRPTDITDLCRNIIETVSLLTEKQDINISFLAEEHMRIVADRELVSRLLLNLLSNSLLNCRRGGRISVSLLRTGSNLVMCVDDDGRGIEPDELAFVFDRYKHSECLTHPVDSGIGLAVAKGIAELHGGALIIESRGEDMGTSVRVMLSYDTPPERGLSAPEALYNDTDMQTILTELSGCLTTNCFSEYLND